MPLSADLALAFIRERGLVAREQHLEAASAAGDINATESILDMWGAGLDGWLAEASDAWNRAIDRLIAQGDIKSWE